MTTNQKIPRRSLQQKTNSLGFRLFDSDRIRKPVEQTKPNRSQSSLTKAVFVSKKWGALHSLIQAL